MPTASQIAKAGFTRVAGGDDSRFSRWSRGVQRIIHDAETGAVLHPETLSPEDTHLWILELSAIVHDLGERAASLMTPEERRALRSRLSAIPRPQRARSV